MNQGSEESDGDLEESEVHTVLSNDRRRRAIDLLREEGTLSVRTLSERIAAMEADENPPPSSVRQSVYVSLQQTHLPKLDGLDIVDFDDETKEVSLARTADEVVVYMEVVGGNEIPWYVFYALLGILGALTVVGAAVGVPGLAAVGPSAPAVLLFAVLVVAALYHRYTVERVESGPGE